MTTVPSPQAGSQPLYMIKAEINPGEFARWMRESEIEDPDAAAHRLLTESFGPAGSPRPFRIMEHRRNRMLPLYGYCRAAPEDLRRTALACQDPLQAKVLDPASIESKEMPADWRQGQPLRFELRARPVVRTRKDPERCGEPARTILKKGLARPGAEYDAHRWEVIKSRLEGRAAAPPEAVYAAWLKLMLAKTGAARLQGDGVKLLAMKSNTVCRRPGGQKIPGMDVVMAGAVVVENPGAFNDMLAKGIGRHIAYGHGMLLLKPPD